METYSYPYFPDHLSTVHVALYTEVINAGELRTRIIQAATPDNHPDERETVNFAFVNAGLITSRMHLQTAIYQAILSESQGTLRTKTVHSEILWILNPTNNITEAIRRYGISDSTASMFVVRVTSAENQPSDIQAKMDQVVSGKTCPISECLVSLTDWKTIKKYHKLNNERAVQDSSGHEERQRAIVDNIVISAAAMRSVQQ